MANNPICNETFKKKWKEKGIGISWCALLKTLRNASEKYTLMRLMNRSSAMGDCWIWRGGTAKGYGVISFHGKQWYCHRVSFVLFKGEIEKNAIIRHGCDTPLCFNPSHLISGTVRDNINDCYARNRATVGSNSHHAKVTESQVIEIRKKRFSGVKLLALKSEYGLSEATISRMCTGQKWKHVPMPEIDGVIK